MNLVFHLSILNKIRWLRYNLNKLSFPHPDRAHLRITGLRHLSAVLALNRPIEYLGSLPSIFVGSCSSSQSESPRISVEGLELIAGGLSSS